MGIGSAPTDPVTAFIGELSKVRVRVAELERAAQRGFGTAVIDGGSPSATGIVVIDGGAP